MARPIHTDYAAVRAQQARRVGHRPRRLRRLTNAAAHIHLGWIAAGLAFWLVNLVGFLVMMGVVMFVPALQHSLLYTIQISHWALILTAGVGVAGALALLAGRHRLEGIERAEKDLLTRIREWDRAQPGEDVWCPEIDKVLSERR